MQAVGPRLGNPGGFGSSAACKFGALSRFQDRCSPKLQVPHAFQQSMSSESTPVLSRAISGFEMFMSEWERLGDQHEILRLWTEIGLHWAKKYYVRMDETDVYVVAMCKFHMICHRSGYQLRPTVINPAVRFSWIDEEWDNIYIEKSKNIILNLVSTSIGSLCATNISRTDAPVPLSGFVQACH